MACNWIYFLMKTIFFIAPYWFSSMWPSDTIRHWTSWSTLVQVMVCHLFGTKPLPEPMPTYYQLDPRNYFQCKLNWNKIVFIQENPRWNLFWKCHLQNIGHSVLAAVYWTNIWVLKLCQCSYNQSYLFCRPSLWSPSVTLSMRSSTAATSPSGANICW